MLRVLSLRTGILRSIIALLVFLLAACTNDEDSQVLRIGTNVWPGYEPLYLADSLGYFKDANVRLVEYSSASQVSRAFRNGLIDAAALTLDEVLLLAQYDFEPEIVLVMDVSDGGDAILTHPELGSMEALKGRRIGVENTALGAFVLSRALQHAGMVIDDVNIVPLEVDEHESAYKANIVDAVVTFEPVRSRLLSVGAKQVFDSHQIPGEIVDVLIVRRSYLHNKAASIKVLVNSWYSALDYMSQHREKSMQKISERLHLSVDETIEAYKGLLLPDKAENRRLLAGGQERNPVLLASTQKLLDVMSERKLIRRPVDPEMLFQFVQNNSIIHE